MLNFVLKYSVHSGLQRLTLYWVWCVCYDGAPAVILETQVYWQMFRNMPNQ